jgi:hypothetical protein
MKVQISFELDLEEIIDNNNNLWCYEGRSKEEVYKELKTIFGDDLNKGMSEDAKIEYKNNFQEIFNY